MIEEAKAAAEIAKTTGQAIETASRFAEFMTHFIKGPLEQLSGIVEDRFKFIRWERQVRLMDRAEEVLKARGMTKGTRTLPLNIAVPILQAGSLEENDELQDVWANMLVNAADASVDVQFRRAFISIAEDLAYLDKQVLECIYGNSLNNNNDCAISMLSLPGQMLDARSSVDKEREGSPTHYQLSVSLGNLDRLRMVEFRHDKGEHLDSDSRYIYRTDLGTEFMKAIQEKPRTSTTA